MYLSPPLIILLPVKLQGGDFIASTVASIYFLTEEHSKNEIDDPITTLKERKVIGRLRRIRQSEHWQSRAAGFKPELLFTVRDFEYRDEKQLKYNGIIYNIERVDNSRSVEIELICSKEVNKSNNEREGE